MTDPRDTRLAELEKEVARLSENVRPRQLLKLAREELIFTSHCQAASRARDYLGACADILEQRAKEASPPAPVAQEKPHGACAFCGTKRGNCVACGKIVEFGGVCHGGGMHAHHECADRHKAKDPKPPEVEEPAIVQRLRGMAGSSVAYALTHTDLEVRELLAFIDGRRGGV